jgi:hypothetical protein
MKELASLICSKAPSILDGHFGGAGTLAVLAAIGGAGFIVTVGFMMLFGYRCEGEGPNRGRADQATSDERREMRHQPTVDRFAAPDDSHANRCGS